MVQLSINGLPANDSGRFLVRLNEKYRAGIPRYGIARLTNAENSKSVKVLLLGHNDDSAIFMPYDIREALGADKGGVLAFTVQEVGLFGKIRWLLKTPDPAVHVPAWMAVISVVLGAVGVAITLWP